MIVFRHVRIIVRGTNPKTLVKSLPFCSTGKILKEICGLCDDTHILISEDGSPLGDSDILTNNAAFHVLSRLRGGADDGKVAQLPCRVSLPDRSSNLIENTKGGTEESNSFVCWMNPLSMYPLVFFFGIFLPLFRRPSLL